MRELCWSLWKQRWAFLISTVTVAIIVGMMHQIIDVYSLFEMGYRMAFIVLQIMYLILQRERFQVVLRKESANRFYRSMPNAWEKEQRRFMWIDVFGVVGLVVLLAIGLVFRNEFGALAVPFALVISFLVYMPSSRIVACVPYVWWMTEIVVCGVLIVVPGSDVSPLLCAGTAVAVGVIQVLLYRFVRKLWETED